MPRTAFDPRRHGFAFGNSWNFTEAERCWLHAEFTKALRFGLIIGMTALGPAGAALVLRGIAAMRGVLETRLSKGAFGLCGGMSFAVLDYFGSSKSVPQGNDPHDCPLSGDPLRERIWKRQVDSSASDLARLYDWVIPLNHVPAIWPFRGGAGGLLTRTEREWSKLIAKLDVGDPVPLMLVRDTEEVFSNHQVLANGYEQTREDRGTIFTR